MLSHVILPFDSDGIEPEEFWGRLEKIIDSPPLGAVVVVHPSQAMMTLKS